MLISAVGLTAISGQRAQAVAAQGGGEALDEGGRRLRGLLPRADNWVMGASAQAGGPGEQEGRAWVGH